MAAMSDDDWDAYHESIVMPNENPDARLWRLRCWPLADAVTASVRSIKIETAGWLIESCVSLGNTRQPKAISIPFQVLCPLQRRPGYRLSNRELRLQLQ